jgi:HAD superfamily 5'-nucleotidase-like hydrolase
LGSAARAALLRHALEAGAPLPERRIFVNRTLRMEKIRYVGFDLDWTLAPYYRLPVGELTFGLALDLLVSHYGYPQTVLRAEFRPHFPHRGLIVDRETGAVLKMNRHRYVGTAYLGREPLDRDERARLYRRAPLDVGSDRFYRVDTLIELPEVNLLAELVEISKREPHRFQPVSFAKLFADVREAVDTVHGNGSLKQTIKSDLPRFLPREPEQLLSLQRLLLGNRRLLLITNSEWSYTHALCSYLFDGPAWTQLFDLIVVSARKPDFFRRGGPFVVLDHNGEPAGEEHTPAWGRIYSGGSRAGLMRLLAAPGEQMLYVGDHIYGDIVSSKLTSAWRTALIVSELEDELRRGAEQATQSRHLEALRSELSTMGQRMDDLRDILSLSEVLHEDGATIDSATRTTTRERLRQLEQDHRALRHRAGELERSLDMRMNPTWGSLFKQGSNKSLFGSQVDDFACVYTSRVSNFALYGTNHYFRVLSDSMVHERVD